MKMAIIGAIVGGVLGIGGIHMQNWEYWVVMGCVCAAFGVGLWEAS